MTYDHLSWYYAGVVFSTSYAVTISKLVQLVSQDNTTGNGGKELYGYILEDMANQSPS